MPGPKTEEPYHGHPARVNRAEAAPRAIAPLADQAVIQVPGVQKRRSTRTPISPRRIEAGTMPAT